MTTQTFDGQLEIDNQRGVIYFHWYPKHRGTRLANITLLRICGLGALPKLGNKLVDITMTLKPHIIEY